MVDNLTATQRARELYLGLRRDGLVSLTFTGLMGDAVWITKDRKAYRLHELSYLHLWQIVTKYTEMYRLTNGESDKVPEPVKREFLRRRSRIRSERGSIE